MTGKSLRGSWKQLHPLPHRHPHFSNTDTLKEAFFVNYRHATATFILHPFYFLFAFKFHIDKPAYLTLSTHINKLINTWAIKPLQFLQTIVVFTLLAFTDTVVLHWCTMVLCPICTIFVKHIILTIFVNFSHHTLRGKKPYS